ncbi:MAG: hypothetical protein A2W90_16610 [Bacteroidetes bacterium GWF2_42_66]|nr:MAG: hypothetical protein A2W92_04005 [Bacteroidetes bacterium GWA2_42_15]OFX96316.1 MAG: hypothetical protein A2W89_05540 [Bacteroidetes bacterium GWE2_42_39]OFY46355.1 MAG: hypothetical protein A2W90_16610 [Bacteroidetes bacterium GWF2_42_66]HAZ03477.1 dTDP-4-dehydrorhamnose 3,5-epimerase [Marinilabiliales bacterium]HBL78259.1 dTDP-4-dehydrorhamnose 3,5-epimerase [Prolixibacteraceae bacterium]
MGQIIKIEGVIVTPLKIIEHPKGDLFHIMHTGDEGYKGFGEVYISTINFGDVKAWKKHFKMTSNFAVPFGKIKVVLVDLREHSTSINEKSEFILSSDDYFRLTIPPGVWYGLKGLSENINILINFADIVHDPNEQINIDYNKSEIIYDW